MVFIICLAPNSPLPPALRARNQSGATPAVCGSLVLLALGWTAGSGIAWGRWTKVLGVDAV